MRFSVEAFIIEYTSSLEANSNLFLQTINFFGEKERGGLIIKFPRL
jgi:hypothetical protein